MVVSLKAAEKTAADQNEGNPTATQQGPDTGALAALCAIACFHRVAADPATLAYQLGLQPGEVVSANDRLLGLKANGSTTGPQAGQVINNNSVALSATYTRNGVTRTVGAIDLEANNFFTEFPPEVIDEAGNPVPITAQAQALPQMNGSGMVRNLRAANDLVFMLSA